MMAAAMEEVKLSLPQEPVVAPELQERSADIPVVVLPPEAVPESVTREVVMEPIRPLIEPDMVAEQHPPTDVAAEETGAGEEPAPVAAPEIAVKTTPWLTRALPWAAAGVAVVALACIGALLALYVAGPLSRISLPTLQLPSLCPGSLLLLSGASFAGAALLLGLLLWSRRGSVR
jgi:hypothetical protein